MNRAKAIGIAMLLGLSGLIGFLKLRGCDKQKDTNNSAAVLRPGESEAVIVNPGQHTITLVTKDHVKSFTLPSRPSRVSLLTGDGIKIESPQYGTEFLPFLGAAYTLQGGVVLGGLDLFYWKQLDLGLGLSIDPVLLHRTTAFFGISYFAYSNCSVGVGLDNHVTPILFIKVRL